MPGVIRVEQVPRGVLKDLAKSRGLVLRRRKRTDEIEAVPETTLKNVPESWGVCFKHGMAWFPRRAGCSMCMEEEDER